MKSLFLSIITIVITTICQAQPGQNVIFVGGLERVCNIDRQVELFKIGWGTPQKMQVYKWNHKTTDIISKIQSNPDAQVILFSAGCLKAKEILLNPKINKNKIWLIEPYTPNETLTFIIEWSKFPAKNILVGKTKDRGLGITKGTRDSNSVLHCESLTTSAIIIKQNL